MNYYELNNLIIQDVHSFGWYNALKGMRYPKNSEANMDSIFSENKMEIITIGSNDKKLLFNLIKAGKSHRKILRMLHIQLSMKMPMSFWTQYDTYKVATVSNSRSRMHTITKRLLTESDFFIHNKNSIEMKKIVFEYIEKINYYIQKYNLEIENKNFIEAQNYWFAIIDTMPLCYLQERMLDLSYETALSIALERYNEKLTCEWNFFITTLFKELPLFQEIAIQGGFTSEIS